MQEKGEAGRGSTPPRAGKAPARPKAASPAPAAAAPAAPAPFWRADRGPRPLAALMPHVTKPAFKKRSPAAAQIIADWPALVGPVLAAQTIPRSLTGGTLTLACSGPVAMELQHLAPQLIGKVNAAMGQTLVQRLRFVQAAMPPQVQKAAPPKPVVLPQRLEASLEGIEDPQLREALARLAQGVYRGRRSPG
ncbi:MAG: hypothetical protein JWP20_2836 [Roseomonas sp.]|nr:hypothetical protein [Roseomonas sp.]